MFILLKYFLLFWVVVLLEKNQLKSFHKTQISINWFLRLTNSFELLDSVFAGKICFFEKLTKNVGRLNKKLG